MALGNVVFSPYRAQSPYGAPGYGMYPTRPGTYLMGLGQNGNGNAGNGAGIDWEARFGIGVPTAGIGGIAIGLLVGFLVWGR